MIWALGTPGVWLTGAQYGLGAQGRDDAWLIGLARHQRSTPRLDPMKVCMYAFGCSVIRNPAIAQIAEPDARA